MAKRSTKKKAAARKARGRKAPARRALSKASPKRAAKKAKAAPKKPAAVPAGFHTVTPYLVCRGAAEAIAFYAAAFGAREKMRMDGPGGSVMHAEIKIGDSLVMLGDEMPEMGASSPASIGGTPVHIMLYVKDVDQAFARATDAGATPEMPPTDMFWGDRYCKLADPFGHKWAIATHIEDVSPREMARRAAEAMPPPAQA